MNIQIGMNCDPNWLCNGIEIFLGILAAAGLFGLYRIISREIRSNKRKKRPK